MNQALHELVRRVAERALVRSWEHRQRHYAQGAWHRFRRVLVDAAQAWVLDGQDADRLERDGRIPLPVGQEFDPPLRIFWLTEEQLSTASSRRRVPVRLCAELLQARSLALVPHA